MRLWHEKLIPILPRQQLLGQHREASALRGNGFGKKHATVNYVFNYSPAMLYFYHQLVIGEMQRRGYKPDLIWTNALYRGKNCNPYITDQELWINDIVYQDCECVYPEHDNEYYDFCIELLNSKGVNIKWD